METQTIESLEALEAAGYTCVHCEHYEACCAAGDKVDTLCRGFEVI
ncbi:hypothetical protein LCGC14_1137570 [marine sediment metagenome]|uniref:Uncharacterized protein n=1 Tax=marine sediment metagenome TaxID=412755 RepID=A0A0F9PHF8_9ZZZZ